MYNFVKKLYFYCTYLFNLLGKKYYFEGEVLELFLHPNFDSFYGYFDNYPQNGDLIAFNSMADSKGLSPLLAKVDIVVYSISKGTYEIIDSSRAFNYQQGSRLRWVSNKLYYNDIDDEGQGLIKCWDPATNRISVTVGLAADFISSSEAISFSYLGLKNNKFEYSYPNLHFENTLELEITRHDLINGQSEVLYNRDSILNVTAETEVFTKRYINHLLMSPEKDKFLFLLRYENAGKKWDFLVLGSVNHEEIEVLSKGYFSHCAWKDNVTIVFYGIIDGHRGYYILNVVTGDVNKLPIRDNQDGHMSVFGSKMIYDTYPGWNGYKELWLYDFTSSESRRIGYFRNNPSYFGVSRCDLHPRFSKDFIFIDSNHDGRRRLYRLDFKT
jgi:hypothetical protein